MRGALEILVPLTALSLAGCVTTPKYTKEQITELGHQFAKCMPNPYRSKHLPKDGFAIIVVDIADGGKFKTVNILYKNAERDKRFGNWVVANMGVCQPLKTPITGIVSIPIQLTD